MAAVQDGVVHIVTVSGNTVSGSIRALTNISLTHAGEIDRVPGPDGEYFGLIATGEMLSCDFEYAPHGADAAAARTASAVPGFLTDASITGLPIIAVGTFTDAFNTDAGSTQKWKYEGGATIVGNNTGKWVVRLTLHRYPGIA